MSLTQGPLGRSEDHEISFQITGVDEFFPTAAFSFPIVSHQHVVSEALSQEKDLARQWQTVQSSRRLADGSKSKVTIEAVKCWNESMDEIKEKVALNLLNRLDIYLIGKEGKERKR